MKVRAFAKSVDAMPVDKVIIYKANSNKPVFAGSYINLMAAAHEDVEYLKYCQDDGDYKSIEEYHIAETLLERKLYKGLEDNTAKVRIDPFVNEHGVAVVNIVMCIK